MADLHPEISNGCDQPQGCGAALLEGLSFSNPPKPNGDLPTGSPHTDGKQWTYMVNLTETKNYSTVMFGGVAQFDEIRQLAPSTTDGRSQIMVQVGDPHEPEVSIYKLADGKITKLGQAPSHGYAGDIERFMSLAPSDGKIAFLNQSDGEANAGVAGNSRDMASSGAMRGTAEDMLKGFQNTGSVKDVTEALQSGLQKSGRDKLDLLDFDACLMGTAGVIDAVSPITRNMVASEPIELGGKRLDGQTFTTQSLPQRLREALEQPPRDGTAFGALLVDGSAKECKAIEDPRDPCGVNTIAAYDTSHTEQFSAALSQFGEALSTAIENPKNKLAIEHIATKIPDLTKLPTPPGMPPMPGAQVRDLQSFVQRVESAIDAGTITDDANHTLRKAAAQAASAQTELISKEYSRYPDNLHGVSTVLPDINFDRAAVYDEINNGLTNLSDQLGTYIKQMDSKDPPSPADIRNALLKAERELRPPEWTTLPPIKPNNDVDVEVGVGLGQVAGSPPISPPSFPEARGVYVPPPSMQGPPTLPSLRSIPDLMYFHGALQVTYSSPDITTESLQGLREATDQTAQLMSDHRANWISENAAIANSTAQVMLEAQKPVHSGGWENFTRKLTENGGN